MTPGNPLRPDKGREAWHSVLKREARDRLDAAQNLRRLQQAARTARYEQQDLIADRDASPADKLDDERIPCHLCGKTCRGQGALKRHMQDEHGEITQAQGLAAGTTCRACLKCLRLPKLETLRQRRPIT